MNPQNRVKSLLIHSCRIVMALMACAVLWAQFPDIAPAQDNPIPPEIRNLSMGVTTAAVTERIKSIGTLSTEAVDKYPKRSKLVWVRPDSPYYKDIAFQFTEKDRLYLIRFNLNDSAKAEYHNLKRNVFKDYDFSWERPQKLRIKDVEVTLYGPEKGMVLYFFEFNDRKTHEKAFELFDREISAEDRAGDQPQEKKEGAVQLPGTDQQPAQKEQPKTGEKLESGDKPQETQQPEKAEKTESGQKADMKEQPASAEQPKANATDEKTATGDANAPDKK